VGRQPDLADELHRVDHRRGLAGELEQLRHEHVGAELAQRDPLLALAEVDRRTRRQRRRRHDRRGACASHLPMVPRELAAACTGRSIAL
jgi:hypothetical protein